VVGAAVVSAGAREAVLGRIRAALADVPAREPASADVSPALLSTPGDREMFAVYVADYGATVTRCAPSGIADSVATVCARHGATRLALPFGVPRAWLPPGLHVSTDDPPLPVADLDALDGVLTGAAVAIAETGTILLDGGPLSGRRALTLVPDLHVCVVAATDIVATVPQGVGGVADAVRAGRPVTMISGPSATSDIELSRVEGVHGPRRLEVILVD
jgi:L-lactate dehydrogenase complex protein LldG